MESWSIIAVTVLPLAGMLLFAQRASQLLRPLRHRILFENTDKCVMCRNLVDKPMLERWSIRGEQIPVCKQCHPFFKQRFLKKETTANS